MGIGHRQLGKGAETSPPCVWTRVAALLATFALAAPAAASDLITVNTSDDYVDGSIAAEFVTVPTLCDEPIGTQDTSAIACNPLGAAAVLAAAGVGPDKYWESSSTPLATTNAFVPGNVGNAVNETGYAPLFSDHKYDLFGRAGDRMGVFTRREMLFIDSIPTTGGGITNGQTTPGEDTKLAFLAVLLEQPEGATSVSIGGHTFEYSDLPFYETITGFTSGKADTVDTWCDANVGALICGVLTNEQKAEIYAAVNFPEVQTAECGTTQNGQINETNCKNRDQWMDQTIAGYVEAWESLGGDLHFSQNFRSQVGYDGNVTNLDSTTEVWGDFRLQQSVELSGAFTTRGSDPGDVITPGDNLDGIAGRQTFEYAIATESDDDFGWVFGDKDSSSLGQLVSQDVNGYLFTCLNCDTPDLIASGVEHAFEPLKLDLTYMEYDSGWNVVPTVIHAE